MTIVVDTSVALSWVLPDERAEAAESVLDLIEGHALVAPSLQLAEILNGLLVSVRRGRIDASLLRSLRDKAALLPIEIVSDSMVDLSNVLDLAEQHGLTAYDAVYLDLAIRRSAMLATHDRRLKAAAEAEGLKTLP